MGSEHLHQAGNAGLTDKGIASSYLLLGSSLVMVVSPGEEPPDLEARLDPLNKPWQFVNCLFCFLTVVYLASTIF